MKKRMLALLLIAVMVLSVFTGCKKAPVAENNEPKVTEEAKQNTEKKDDSASSTVTPNVVEDVQVEVAKYSEAPILADLVAAGSLAPVEDRIPNEDNVFVETNDATGKALVIGTYGGSINLKNGGGGWDLSRPILESIIHYNTDGTYYPNVMKAIEHNDDYTVWTFRLREGMKWSDGVDFTADDVTFWYYMCHINNFDTKASWTALIDYTEDYEETNAETGEVETKTKNIYANVQKVDNYTVTFTFVNPKYPADFIENGDFKWCWAPAHYFADLIPSSFYVENPYYGDTGLSDEQVLANAMAKGIEQATVKDLGKQAVYYFWNISGVPTLNGFVLSTVPGNSSRNDDLCILNRNPYFWKVDAKGNQLPYVDELHFVKTSADGQDQLMFRSGEIDLIEVAMADISSILGDMGDAAMLKTFASTNWGSYQITFNYTTTDANYAELFANPKFREAMSICVDRNAISGLLTDGFLEPGQACPAEGNFGYDAEWEQKWTEYDVAKAKSLFEECGLKMGADGFYDFADGSDCCLTFYTYTESGAYDSYPVFEQYFKAAGINCANKDVEVAAFDTIIDNNEWNAVLGPHTAIGGLSLKSRVAPFVPVAQASEWYGEYGTYYQTNGAQGVAPTGDMAKLVELYEKWSSTPDTELRDAIALQIYDIHKANLWSIGYLKAAGTYSIVNSKLGNYPDNLVSDDLYQYGNIVHYWTLFKAE